MSVHGPLGATPQGGGFELTRPGPSARGRTSRVNAGGLGLAGLLLTGLVVSVSAAGTDSLLPESVRPVPSWLAGPFGSAGLDLGTAGLILVMSLMFISYAVAVRASHRLSGRAVLMSIAALHALVLLAPPLFSTDVFSYQAYARIGALYGANPYLQGPHVIALDPLYSFIGAKWVTIPTAYGPIFTSLSYLLAPLSIAASVLSYKAIAAIASLATVAFVWNSARLRGLDPVRAAALVGLNPLIVMYGVGGGHNDLLMLAAVAGGIYLLLRRRGHAGGGLLVLAAGLKLTAGLLVPFAIAGGGGWTAGRRREVLTGGAVGAALVATLGFGVFGSGPLHLLATAHQAQSMGDWHSLPGLIGAGLGLGAVGHAASTVLLALFAGVFGRLLWRVWRGELDWIDGAGWATAALLLTATALFPWYLAWLMPLAALGTDRRLTGVAVGLAGFVQVTQLLGYIPHGASLLGT